MAQLGSVLLILFRVNISEIDLGAIVAESNIEWTTYIFIPCYFAIIDMYSYVLI